MTNFLKKPLLWILILVFVVVAGVAVKISEEELASEDVALKVNNTVFDYEEFNNIAKGVAQEFQMYGTDITREIVKEEAVERAVQQAILLEYATEKEVEATEEEINTKFNEVMELYGEENEEDFLSSLEKEGIHSRKEIDDILMSEIKINKLIEIYEDDQEVTEEELAEAYNEYTAQVEMFGGEEEEEVPSFEEVKEDLRKGMIQERAVSSLLEKIEELKKEAEIEVFITEEELEIDDFLPEEEEEENKKVNEGAEEEEVESEVEEE